MAYLAPVKIDLAGEGGVHIWWNDGHESVYPCRYLRAQCSCAHCKHEWTGRRLVMEDQIDPGVFPMEVVPVGRYGISFVWNDGHRAGIYTFDNLRGPLCRCAECAPGAFLQAAIDEADRMPVAPRSGGGCGGGSCGCGKNG